MASEVTLSKEEWEQMKADEAASGRKNLGGDGSAGSTGARPGSGATAGFAQQLSTTFDEKDDDGEVPDELPGEHRY